MDACIEVTGEFQTPKGVCLIGASLTARCIPSTAGIPDAERRLPHWSTSRIVRDCRLPDIPDAERRLPHWSGYNRLATTAHINRFQTPKGVCLIGAPAASSATAACPTFQTPKGVCLIGAGTTASPQPRI